MALRPPTTALCALCALAALALVSCASPRAQAPGRAAAEVATPIRTAGGAPQPATKTASPAAVTATATAKAPAASAASSSDPTPDDVFDAAKALFDQKAYEPAIEGFRAYRKAALKAHEKAHDAWEAEIEARTDRSKAPRDAPKIPPRVAQALYYEGISESEIGEKARAHDLFREILVEHKSFPDISDVVRRDYEIALAFIEGKAERPVPVAPMFHMKSESLGAEALQFLIDNYQQKSFDFAQFRVGEYHLERRDWRRAADAYANVEQGWRDGPWAGPAQVRRATCYLRQSRGYRYDPTPVDKAEEILLDYVRKNPTGSRIQDAEALLREVRDGRAALYAENAHFYLFRERKPRAALVYVSALVREGSGSPAAEEAPDICDDIVARSEDNDPACASEARELKAEIERRKNRVEGPPRPPTPPTFYPPGHGPADDGAGAPKKRRTR